MQALKTTLALLGAAKATSLNIVTPENLKLQFGTEGEVQGHIGHFGHFAYGTSFTGRLHYPARNTDACTPFKTNDFSNDYLFDEADDQFPILVIEAGGCS